MSHALAAAEKNTSTAAEKIRMPGHADQDQCANRHTLPATATAATSNAGICGSVHKLVQKLLRPLPQSRPDQNQYVNW